ncbi:MAG: shikimate kinase [Clostridiales bacterium]|nr:shikimate kinase [Clostridiales bacterium]
MKNIILIGMPGSGKSTVGVILAKAANMSFVDTDLLIQQQTGTLLQNTIDTKGIDEFLKIENDVLKSLVCENAVIATGGSAIYSEEGMTQLKKNGLVVFLDVPLGELLERVTNMKTRGIVIGKGNSFESVFESRMPLYKKYADFTVNCAKQHIEETVNQINKIFHNS